MKESLEISNFGPIKEAKIENIEQLVVLVGESGSGKSILMRLLKTLRTICNYENAYDVFGKYPKLFNKIHEISPYSVFVRDRLSDLLNHDTKIVYEKGTVTVRYDGSSMGMRVLKKEYENLNFSRQTYKFADRYILALMKGGSVSVPCNERKYSEMNADFTEETRFLNSLQMPYIGYVFKKQNKEFKVMNLSNRKFYEPICDAPSSVQSAFPIATALNFYLEDDLTSFLKDFLISIAFENDAVVQYNNTDAEDNAMNSRRCVDMYVEEPENHIFPTQQLSFFNFIIRNIHDIREKKDFSLTLSTHSPYILNYLNLMFKAFNKGKYVNGANLNFEETGVYQIENGILRDLKLKNARIIDPKCLSSTIDDIYEKYMKIK